MIRTFARLLAGVLLLGVCAVQTQAQTIEVFAGGRQVNNMDALQAPVIPYNLSVGPDGTIYVFDGMAINMKRRNPATSVLTIGAPGPASSIYQSTHYAFFGRPGVAYLLRDFTLYERQLNSGASTSIARVLQPGAPPCSFRHPHEGDMTVDGNGIFYFTDWYSNSVCAITSPNTVNRIAGSDTAGFAGDGGLALAALFNYPTGIAVDAANNVYVADSGNNRIRRISAATGMVSTFVGTGDWAYAGENVPAATASIANPTRMTFDPQGNLYVVEHPRVRRIDAQTGLMTTVAGNGTFSGTGMYSGNVPEGVPATQVPLGLIEGIAIAPNGDLLLSDRSNLRVRRVARDTGLISTVIGNGTMYFCGETSTPRQACLHVPRGLAIDPNGDVYISDSANRRVRKVSATTGMLTTVAGRFGDDTWQGEGGLAVDANFAAPLGGVALDASGNLYIAGYQGYRVNRVDRTTGVITTVAGSGVPGFSGDGGLATEARTNAISSVVVDPAGNLYFSDQFNHRIRKVAAGTGLISTIAGNGLATGPLGDGGPATAASLNAPWKIGFDARGNLLIGDWQHNRIRKVDLATGIITTVVGNGSTSSSGNGGLATAAGVNNAKSFAVDAVGNIFIADGATVRRVDATTGIIDAVTAQFPMTPEGFGITDTIDMALDSSGRLYLGTYNVVLRMGGLPVVTQDETPPVIGVVVSGTEGNDGWYRGDVQVDWEVTEAESTIISSSGCDTSWVTTDTAGITFTCTASSSGGIATRSVTVRRDATPPVAHLDDASPVATAAGWHNSDVTIPFTATDATSGVGSVSTPSPLTFTGEGAGIARSLTVTDVAGNSATYTQYANIDRTPPVISITVPAAGASYAANSVVASQYSCSDALSGMDSCTGAPPSGTALPTDTTGSKTFLIVATDAAGNIAGASRNYTVTAIFTSIVFERWIELRRSPKHNGVIAGSLVPIRWRLLDGSGQPITNPAAFQSITVLPFTCQAGPSPFNFSATGGPGLSVDPATAFFTYNWQTEAGSTGCRRVQLRFADNSMQEVIFTLQ